MGATLSVMHVFEWLWRSWLREVGDGAYLASPFSILSAASLAFFSCPRLSLIMGAALRRFSAMSSRATIRGGPAARVEAPSHSRTPLTV